MTETSMIAGLPPVHPGEMLREEILPSTQLSKTAFAERIHVSRQTLYDLLNGKQGVTAAMALRLGQVFGNSPQFWLNLQQTYDLKRAQAELGDDIKRIEPISAPA